MNAENIPSKLFNSVPAFLPAGDAEALALTMIGIDQCIEILEALGLDRDDDATIMSLRTSRILIGDVYAQEVTVQMQREISKRIVDRLADGPA